MTEEEKDRLQELEDLKIVRAKKFISEYPTNRYSIQFERDKPMKASELKTLEIRRRRAERQQIREEMNTILMEVRKNREDQRRIKQEALATAKQLKKQEKKGRRLERIKEAHDLIVGRTLEQVGVLMGGITRQRVNQLLLVGELMGLPRWERNQSARPFVEKTCSCGKTFKHRNPNRKYCSRGCMRKYATPELARMAALAQNRNRYHSQPGRKEKQKIASKRWRDNLKKDPVRWAEFRRGEDAYQKKWRASKLKK